MVTIRQAELNDAQEMLDIYGPIIEQTPTSFELTVPSIGDFQSRVSKTLKTHPWLICEINKAVAGYAYAGPHRSREAYQWSVELSVYIKPRFQRHGVARALYTALMSVLKLQGFYNALAGISLPNAISVGFHESMGFTPVGVYNNVGYKFNQWQSVGWWEYPMRPFDEQPRKPLTLKQVIPSDEWAKIRATAASLVRSSIENKDQR